MVVISVVIRMEFISKSAKMNPSRPRKCLNGIVFVILKPMTRSIGGFIRSGFAGITTYAPAITAAYAVGIIAFWVFKAYRSLHDI